jgi:hypothetical protein
VPQISCRKQLSFGKMNSRGRRRGEGGGDESSSEDEGYELGEAGEYAGKCCSWKSHLGLLKREMSTGSKLLRDGSQSGTRWQRLIIHPDYWYVHYLVSPLPLSLYLFLYLCGSICLIHSGR